jgi:hypothetical protein
MECAVAGECREPGHTLECVVAARPKIKDEGFNHQAAMISYVAVICY